MDSYKTALAGLLPLFWLLWVFNETRRLLWWWPEGFFAPGMWDLSFPSRDPDQRPLHWKAGSETLDHEGSPGPIAFFLVLAKES